MEKHTFFCEALWNDVCLPGLPGFRQLENKTPDVDRTIPPKRSYMIIVIPSGKLLHTVTFNYGKSPCLMGKYFYGHFQ